MKFYRYSKNFYKITGAKSFEKITAYKFEYSIQVFGYFSPELKELEEITEAQYNRVRRLILKKLI